MIYNTTLEKFENANGFIDRDTLVEVLKELKIQHKEDIYYIKDKQMIRMSGHNKLIRIIDISDILTKGRLNKLMADARMLAYYHYVNNNDNVTLVKNKDTGIIIEIGKYGQDKSFRGNVTYEKLATCNKLISLFSEAIYLNSTFRKYKKEIICHNFVVPVITFSKRKGFVRIVVKQYRNRTDLNNKFYYHEIKYFEK